MRRLYREILGLNKYGQARLTFGERLLLWLTFVFLLFEVFSGALRYYLALSGIAWLIYVPKMLISVVLLAQLMWTLYKQRISRLLALVLVTIAFYALVGLYYTGNILQVGFGVYGLFPFLLGLMIVPPIEKLGRRLLPYLLLFWLCAALGVWLDYWYDVPWQGVVYSVGDVTVQASREGWTFGLERVSGFSRASYDAAGQLLFLAIGILWLTRSRLLIVVIWIATGVLIALTTTKRTVGTYILLTLLLPLVRQRRFFRTLRGVVGSVLPWMITLIGIALPASTLFIDYSLSLSNPVSLFLLASFEDRLTRVWPGVFDMLYNYGSLWFGRGIGGIGAAQKYFEENLYTYADNVYLQLYGLFGVMSFLIIYFYTRAVSRLLQKSENIADLMWFWAMAVLLQGWAVAGIDGVLIAMILGITWRFAVRIKEPVRQKTLYNQFLYNNHIECY